MKPTPGQLFFPGILTQILQQRADRFPKWSARFFIPVNCANDRVPGFDFLATNFDGPPVRFTPENLVLSPVLLDDDFWIMNLSEALKVMESGKPFSCRAVAFDHKRKTGGHVKYYPELVHSKSTVFDDTSTKSRTKAQNHFEHATRNFLKCANGQPTSVVRKIHIILLLEVNGQKVML